VRIRCRRRGGVLGDIRAQQFRDAHFSVGTTRHAVAVPEREARRARLSRGSRSFWCSSARDGRDRGRCGFGAGRRGGAWRGLRGSGRRLRGLRRIALSHRRCDREEHHRGQEGSSRRRSPRHDVWLTTLVCGPTPATGKVVGRRESSSPSTRAVTGRRMSPMAHPHKR